jgi:O-antigen ligase
MTSVNPISKFLPDSASRFFLPAIAVISAAVAILSLQSKLIPLGFLLALMAAAALTRIKPRPLEILFLIVPMIAPTIPAFTGLGKHYIVLTIGWTTLFLAYWYFQCYTGAWSQDSIRTPFIYPLIIYHFIFTISLLTHPLHQNALNYSVQSLLLIGIYWFLAQTLRGQNLTRLLEAIVWGSVLSMLAFLIFFTLNSPRYLLFGLVSGLLRPVLLDFNANSWSWATLVGMPLATAFLVHGLYRRGKLIVILAGIFVLLIAALACNSRSALVAIGISTIFIMLTHTKVRIRFLVWTTGLMTVLFLAIPQTWTLALSIFRVKRGLAGRGFLWNLASEYISSHPLTGIGPGWFHDRMAIDLPPVRDRIHMIPGRLGTHNAFLQTASDLGVFALLPLLFIIGFFAWRSVRLWKKMRGGPDFPILVAICALMIAGLTRAMFETDFIFLHGYLTDSLILLIVLAVQDLLYSREFARP